MADRRDFQQAKEQVKARIDIATVVGESVPLKRSGRSLKGLCPFHDEKTPSFHVFPDSQHFKCFGCGEGGDVITFVMKQERLDFVAALRQLADRAGVKLPDRSPAEQQGDRERHGLAGVLAQVQSYFVERLRGDAGARARRYLEERGLDAAITPFALGWAPGPAEGASFADTRWPLVEWFRRRNLPAEAGVRIGVLARSRQGHLYDRFRDRVMFPIHDERGRVVGFGGRVLPGGESETEPKYLNSPESPVFNKRRVLFGLHQARTAKSRRLVVMEGYTDVVAAQLAGVEGAVATLGTSLTTDHAALLRRFAPDGVTLLFDGDEAGRSAAGRAFWALAGEVLPARICLLPEGSDPADLVRTGGRAGLEAELQRAEDALPVFLRLLADRFDLRQPDGKAQAVQECVDLLGQVPSRFRREDLLQRFASGLMLPPDVLAAGLGRRRRRRPTEPEAEAAPAAPSGPLSKARIGLLAALLADPPVLSELTEIWPGAEACFPEPFLRVLVEDLIASFLDRGAFPASSELLDRWLTLASEPSQTELVLTIEAWSRTVDDPLAAVRDGVKFLRVRLHRQDYEQLKAAYREAAMSGDESRARELEPRLAELARRLAAP